MPNGVAGISRFTRQTGPSNHRTAGKVGLPRWLCGKESACQCRRGRLHPWVRKTPWRRKWQSTPVFLPGKSHGLASYSPRGHKRFGHDLVTKQICRVSPLPKYFCVASYGLRGSSQDPAFSKGSESQTGRPGLSANSRSYKALCRPVQWSLATCDWF